MGLATFASLRSQLPAPTIAAVAGGNLTGSGTLEISVQGRNRAGFNLPTALQSVVYTAGQKIQITIPSSARAAGEDIHWYVISIATASADLTSIRQVAIYNGFDVDQVTPRSLPATIELTEDAHIVVGAGQTVAALANLPTGSDLINGMIRQVTDIGDASGRILRYDAESVATVDNDTVFTAATGRWIQVGSFSTYVANTENAGGSDRALNLLPPSAVLQPPAYAADGSTHTPVKYWWYGTRNAAGAITPQGTRIGFRVFDDGVDKTSQFDGLLQVTFDGYADPSTGALDTSGMTTGGSAPFAFGKAGAIALEKDLPAGQAAQFSIQAKFTSAQLKDVGDGSKISIIPRSFSQSGDFNPASGFTGNAIFPEGDRLRIVPDSGLSVKALSGSAAVGRLTFPLQDAIAVTGLTSDTADQIIEVNGNGNIFVGDGTIGANEAIRAKVGTLSGRSPASDFSGYAAVTSGQTLTVTVTNGRDIRADYPEPSTAVSVIAGNTEAVFNPPTFVVYLQREGDGQLWEFDGNAVTDTANQQVTISNLSDGTAIANLPTVAPTFGLFKPTSGSFTANAGSSDLTADNYRIAIAYIHDGNQVTQIQHEKESSDWIEEIKVTLAEITNSTKWHLVSGVPSGTLGKVSDFALNQTNGDYYEKTGETTWTLRGTLRGPNGVDGFGLVYGFDTGTAAGPDSGELRLNNAAIASVTAIYISETDANSVNVAAVLGEIEDTSIITLRSRDDANEYAYFQVSGTPTDNGGDRTIPVTYLSHAPDGDFTNLESVLFTPTLRGPQGDPGAIGPVGGFGNDFIFDSDTTATPGSGEVRWNNANPSAATELYLSETDAATIAFLDLISTGSTVEIVKKSDISTFARFVLTSITDNGSDRTYGVNPAGNNGTFTDGDAVRMAIAFKGDTGATGAVSAASALVLQEQVSDPSTAADEVKVFNNGDVLKWRKESDGDTYEVAQTVLVENAQTGTSYTLVLADAFKGVTLNNASPITLNLPDNATTAFPVGSQILIGQKGAGTVTVTPASGVNINGANTAIALSGQWSLATLWKIGTNEWWLAGGIS